VVSGFVQYRRGLVEHLIDGRLSAMEFAAFSAILLLVDHRSYTWLGSANLLSKILHIRNRWSQKLMISLRVKGYVNFVHKPGSHDLYSIQVPKFCSASQGQRESVPGAESSASQGQSIQEVRNNNGDKGPPPQKSKGLPPNFIEPSGWESRTEHQKRFAHGA
jgi:hypothetical protein